MSVLEGDGGFYYTVEDGDNLSEIWKNHPEFGYSKWTDLRDKNIEEILRVGRARMEAVGIGENVTRNPCGLGGEYHTGKGHSISAGIHYDGVGQPTIYPGTTFFIKKNKEEDESGEEKEEKKETGGGSQGEDEVIKSATNSISTGVFSQHPNPRIELYEFDGSALSLYMAYDGEAAQASRRLLSYEFGEAVDDVKGSFSFSVANETYKNKETVFEKIKLRSIVYIYEGGDRVFIGVIRRKSVGSAMQAAGPRKTITFSGCSLMGLVSDFVLSLDIKIMDVPDAEIASRDLTIDLIPVKKIGEFLRKTLDSYVKLTVRTFEMNDCETVKILKAVTNKSLDIFAHGKNDSEFSYNIANVFYSQGQNNIVDMWRNILPNPVYEIYGYCEREKGDKWEKGDMRIMAREAPFDPKPWKALRVTKIEPVSLKSYSLQQGDEEVYTVFNCWLEGSEMEHNFYTTVEQYDKEGGAMVVDGDKLKRYGYRPLEIAFRGYDRSQNTEKEASGLTGRFRQINERARRWYSRLDDMFSGSITIVTNFVEPWRNPRIGEKVSFLGGEFYVRGASHSWSYGGNPAINLSVSRGMAYDGNGEMPEGGAGILLHPGGERRELE